MLNTTLDDQINRNISESVALHRKLIEERTQYKKFYGDVEFAHCVATFHVSFGRFTGKSSWIREIAGDGDLILTTGKDASEKFRGIKADVRTINSLANRGARGKSYSVIYFDDSNYMDRREIHRAYKVLVVKDALQQFIHIG